MIKIVPDPPPGGNLYKTVTTPFGSCDAGHGPLLAVCAGINAEDALVHASLALKGARDTAHHACMNSEANEGLLWSTFHSIELAKALVDAVVDGVEIEGDGGATKAER